MSTAYVKERNRSRVPNVATTSETLEVKYNVYGATNEADARLTSINGTPATEAGEKGTLTKQSVSVEPINPQGGFYVATVQYTLVDFTTGQTLFNFDTTGGTQHIVASKSTVNAYGVGGSTPPNFKNMINATADDVQGVDITLRQFGFSATKFVYGTNVTGAYVSDLVTVTGTTNNGTWTASVDGISFTFQRREALFMGASGSRRGGGDFEINYHFGVSGNATNLTVGDITGIAKAGWDYLWVRREKQEIGTAPDVCVAEVAKYVYVEQIYDETNFNLIGL